MLINLSTKISKFVAVTERTYQLCTSLGLAVDLDTNPNEQQDDNSNSEEDVEEEQNNDILNSRRPLITSEEKIHDETGSVVLNLNDKPASSSSTSSMSSLDEEAVIQLKDIQLKLSASNKIIGPLSLTLHRGEMIHLKGATGIGKTSILKLLRGMYGAEMVISGEIKLPFRNEGTTYSKIKFLPQTSYISSNVNTIRGIIMYPETSQGTKEETLRVQKCLNQINWRRQLDIDYIDNNWSSFLSNGEIQLLMIASVLFKNPLFAILDEPTSALDHDSEVFVINALKESGIGILFVSHSNIEDDDIKVIHMK